MWFRFTLYYQIWEIKARAGWVLWQHIKCTQEQANELLQMLSQKVSQSARVRVGGEEDEEEDDDDKCTSGEVVIVKQCSGRGWLCSIAPQWLLEDETTTTTKEKRNYCQTEWRQD